MNRPTVSRRIVVHGTNTGAFDRTDWALTFTVASLWGSSFLLVAIGLDSLDPRVVAFARVALGAAVLWTLPAARHPVPRSLWPTIAIIAVAGNAAPALLFAFAQRTVDSSVAAMVSSATPVAVVFVGIVLARHGPGTRQLVGIVIGLVGVAAIAAPRLLLADAEPGGAVLLAIAVIGYGISNNVIVGPQQSHGALPIVARALLIASLVLTPFALAGRAESEVTGASMAAVVVLGVGGTGIARALNATLAGRTGAARGSITTYLVPVIAVVLGVTIRNETISPIQLAGLSTVLASAWLTTRPTHPPPAVGSPRCGDASSARRSPA